MKANQKATVKYVIEGTTTVLHTDELEGKSGEAINYSTATKLADLKVLGYELVTDGFTTATDKNFDNNPKVDQNFVVTVKPKVVDISPFDPTNPNDPNTPKPGQPIDPENPTGPKWSEELIKSLDTTKHVNRTISYVKEDGSKVEYLDKDGKKSTADVTDKVTFTRALKVNVVTGKIVDPNVAWISKDTTFEAVKSPVAPGYVLKANQDTQGELVEYNGSQVNATTGLTENSKDETIKVVYVPVGKLVPKVPEGVTPPTPVTPTPYENVPGEPGKVVPPSPTKPQDPQDPNSPKVPVIPHIPGTTPHVPKDPTEPVGPNNPLVPLKPIDPKDPSKGYEVPPVPNDPTKDTPIEYVPNNPKDDEFKPKPPQPQPNPRPYLGPNPTPAPQPAPAPQPEPKPEPQPETPKPATPGENGDNNGTPTNNGDQTQLRELPNTGTDQELSIFGAAASAILAGLGLIVPGKKKEEEEE